MKCFCGRTRCIKPLQFKEVIGYCGKMSPSELKKSDNFYERLAYHAGNPFGAPLSIFKKTKTHFNEIQKNAAKVANPTDCHDLKNGLQASVRSNPPPPKYNPMFDPLAEERFSQNGSDLDFVTRTFSQQFKLPK